MTEGLDDRRTGQEDNKMTEGQDDKMTGQQKDRTVEGLDSRTTVIPDSTPLLVHQIILKSSAQISH